MNHYKQAISPFGEREVSIEFGEIGRQADAAVMVDMEGTVVLVAVTGRREALPNASFLPLTVDYQEKNLCRGQNPRRDFFRREGPPKRKRSFDLPFDRSLLAPVVSRFLLPRNASHRHGDVFQSRSRSRHSGHDRRGRRRWNCLASPFAGPIAGGASGAARRANRRQSDLRGNGAKRS